MVEFVVEITLSLPGYLLLTVVTGKKVDHVSPFLMVVLSLAMWIAACGVIYGATWLLMNGS